jgi:hypothetical protein
MASVQEHPKGILQAIPNQISSIMPDTSQPNAEQTYPQVESPLPFSHPFYSHLFSNMSIEDEQGRDITASIQRGTLLACCDGSFDPITRNIAYGLVLVDTESKVHLLKLQGPCVGHVNARSVIRVELSGLTATTHLLLTLILKFGVNSGSLTLYNDCSKALKYINHPGQKFKRFLTNDYDLLCDIRSTIHQLQKLVSFNLVWVKGHFTGKNREPQYDLNAEAHN